MAILPPPASPRNFAPYGASGLAPGGAPRTMPTPMQVPRNPKSPAPKAGRAGSMPKPPTDLQSAQQQVAAAYDPVLQQIKDAYNQMVQSTGAQYNAGSKQLADLYGQYGPRVQQAYSQAGQGLAAVQGMLAATQQGQGVSAASDLARQLQGIDASTAGRVSGNFGQNLQGEALANATAGGNNLAALLAEGAHAGQYGAVLPGVGGQIGFQGLQQALGTLNANQKDELAKLAAEEPGAVQTALGNIQSNQYKQQALNNENFYKQQVLNNTQKKTNASITQGKQRVTIAQQNANTAATRAANSAAAQADASARGWASIGIREKAAQTKAAADEKKLKSGGFTPEQVQRYKGTALTLAQNVYQGFTDSKGTVHKPLTYQQAVLEGRKEGIPVSIITASLNQFYKPGQRGRPMAPLQISPKAYKTAPTAKTTKSLKGLGGAFGG